MCEYIADGFFIESKLLIHLLHFPKKQDSLSKLVTVLSSGIHRALVIPDETSHLELTVEDPSTPPLEIEALQGEPVIITQTDLVQYFFMNNESLGSILDTKASEIMSRARSKRMPSHQATRPTEPVTISIRNSALLGFKKMWAKKVSSLGVVDDEGCLVSVLTAEDLRGMTGSNLTLGKALISKLKVC